MGVCGVFGWCVWLVCVCVVGVCVCGWCVCVYVCVCLCVCCLFVFVCLCVCVSVVCVFPHIFVWDSCFLVLYPAAFSSSSSSARRLPPLVLTQLVHTHTQLVHTTCSHTTSHHTTSHHTTCPHTTCPHTTCPLSLCVAGWHWAGNVLRATTACTFSTSQLPKVVRTRRFREPTFRPSGAPNHWKNTVFRDFPTFSRICIFCLLTLSLLIFLFSLPLPCSAFSSVHIVGSLTSKLPSNMSLLIYCMIDYRVFPQNN